MLLKLIRTTDQLWLVALVQHLLILAVGTALYGLLARRGLPRWLAALVTVPLLYDGYQVTVEHYVLAESLFTTLVVAGLCVLLWPDRLTWVSGGAAGLLLALSVTVRVVSLPLVAVTVIVLLVRRVSWVSLLAYCLAAALPIAGYQVWFHDAYDRYGFSLTQDVWLYGRVAPVADCERLRLSTSERRLCSPEPVGVRPVRSDWYIFAPDRPGLDATPQDRSNFAIRVFTQQPDTMALVILTDTGRYLVPNTTHPDWRCVTEAIQLPAEISRVPDYDWCGVNVRQDFDGVNRPETMPDTTALTRVLGWYGHHVHTPNLLLGLSVLLALAAVVWRPRRRTAVPVTDVLALGGWGLGLIVLAVAGSMFDERYGLPALPLLPAAAALAGYRLWLLRHPAAAPAIPGPRRAEADADRESAEVTG